MINYELILLVLTVNILARQIKKKSVLNQTNWSFALTHRTQVVEQVVVSL